MSLTPYQSVSVEVRRHFRTQSHTGFACHIAGVKHRFIYIAKECDIYANLLLCSLILVGPKLALKVRHGDIRFHEAGGLKSSRLFWEWFLFCIFVSTKLTL